MNKARSFYYYFLSLQWFQKLLIVSVVMLVIAYTFRALTPDQVPVQPAVLQHITSSPVNLENIEYRGTYPAIPEQMPTATIEYQDVNEELLQNILSAFSIPNTKTANDVWEGNEYNVIELSDPKRYSVSRIANFAESSSQVIDPNTAIAEAQKIIDGLYTFDSKPEVITTEIEILNDEPGELETTTTEQFIRIPFAFTVKDIPVFVEQERMYVAEFVFDSSYVLQKAIFRPYTLTVSTNRNYKTIDPNEAVNRVNQNQAAVVFYRYYGPNAADFSSIQSGVLNQTEIEYRLDPTTKTAVPYYRFSGELINTAGYEIETTLITPALNTNFSN